MRGLDRRRWLGLVPVLLSLAAGCGGEGSQSAGAADDKVFLETFAEDYRMYTIKKKQPPRKVDDMKALQNMVSPAVESARQGDIIVEWGASLPDTMEEPGHTSSPEILAYGKDVPEKGGYVLHLDRTISKMTPEEFKAAPKAASSAEKKL
ncbi:hypothetical protein [Paludisphaera rhizosphaerae]|uniref:hypothetical protein n=1 Tax=Paludisphaera rhizosphaerae TaxID=2711216 RepID=UPI0013ED278A|nr:hypothetical protein [Paludisphaera rhizosphaerae]